MKRKTILILLLVATSIVNAQTDFKLAGGENGFLFEAKQQVLNMARIEKGIGQSLFIKGQFRSFGDTPKEKRNGALFLGYNFTQTKVVNMAVGAGYTYNNRFTGDIGLDIRFTRGFYISASYDYLRGINIGLKVRLSDLDEYCKCSYRRN